MQLNNKKLFAIAILALLLSLVSYSAVSVLSSAQFNILGQPTFNDSLTIDCQNNISCSQNITAKTITISSNSSISMNESDPIAMSNISTNIVNWNLWITDKINYFTKTETNNTFYNKTASDSRYLNTSSNYTPIITKITCSGGVTCSMSLDGDLSLVSITGSSGITTTALLDDNILLNITTSGGLVATYI